MAISHRPSIVSPSWLAERMIEMIHEIFQIAATQASESEKIVATMEQMRSIAEGNRSSANEMSDSLTLLSARFEGFDERVVEHLATDAVSIGPYVLSGGELPAMVVLEAVARRLPGAMRAESAMYESFSPSLEGGLEFPQYTRPAEFRGWQAPEVLLSGDHGRIDSWRREQSRERTLS